MFKTFNNSIKKTRIHLLWSLSLIVLVSFGAMCPAAEYYVSTTGNNATGNGSIDNPWQTITKGQSMLSPGDTLFVREGTYRESVTITSQGSVDNPITIKAYPNETPILDGRAVVAGWTQCSANEPGLTVAGKTNIHAANIYKTDIDTSNFVGGGLWWMIYENDVHSYLCRWPEQSEGYGLDPTEFQDVPTESVGTSASLKDNTYLNPNTTDTVWYPYIHDLTATQLQSYWNDTYVQFWFKSGANATGSYLINGYSNNEITTSTLRRALLTDDTYCMYRHPHLVNGPGKFYFTLNQVNGYQTFYLWPNNPDNLQNKITVPSLSKGFYASNKDYVVIDGFRVVGFQEMGIHFINATSASAEMTEFTYKTQPTLSSTPARSIVLETVEYSLTAEAIVRSKIVSPGTTEVPVFQCTRLKTVR